MLSKHKARAIIWSFVFTLETLHYGINPDELKLVDVSCQSLFAKTNLHSAFERGRDFKGLSMPVCVRCFRVIPSAYKSSSRLQNLKSKQIARQFTNRIVKHFFKAIAYVFKYRQIHTWLHSSFIAINIAICSAFSDISHIIASVGKVKHKIENQGYTYKNYKKNIL